MRVLITGGAGFLGYHLADHLAQFGHSSILYDVAPAELAEYPQGTVAILGDVRDHDSLDAALAEHQPEMIVHGAAALPLWKPADIMSVNVTGTRNVLRLARKHGIDRVVFVSSTAVYGVPEKHPLYEDDPLVGVGPYGESKILAERACVKARQDGLCVPIIRPKTFIGTGRLGVFQILYDWVESGVRIPVIGSGRNRYQLLEVDDLCSAIYLAMTAPRGEANNVFNVGAKCFRTVFEDVGALCEYAGRGSRPMPTPARPVKAVLRVLEALRLSPLYKWVYGTADKDSFVSTERIEQTLGWQPRYSNAEALIRSYQWYLDHKHELAGATGITHRVAWRQGMLRPIKWALRARGKLGQR